MKKAGLDFGESPNSNNGGPDSDVLKKILEAYEKEKAKGGKAPKKDL